MSTMIVITQRVTETVIAIVVAVFTLIVVIVDSTFRGVLTCFSSFINIIVFYYVTCNVLDCRPIVLFKLCDHWIIIGWHISEKILLKCSNWTIFHT